MNKAELVSAIAEKAECTKAEAKRALEAVVDITAETLKKGDKVALIGFGTFAVTERAARKGRNPKTKAEINIPAKKVVKFKASNDLI